MAEGLLRAALPSHEIFSAGLCALDGAPADPIAKELMWQAGVDISGHRARNLASWMMRESWVRTLLCFRNFLYAEFLFMILFFTKILLKI